MSEPGQKQPLASTVDWPPIPSPDSKQEFQKIRFQGETDDAVGARERHDNIDWSAPSAPKIAPSSSKIETTIRRGS